MRTTWNKITISGRGKDPENRVFCDMMKLTLEQRIRTSLILGKKIEKVHIFLLTTYYPRELYLN